MTTVTRIRVRTPPQLGSHHFWYIYCPENLDSVGDLLDGILQEVGLYGLDLKLGLYLHAYELLPATSIDAVRDGDIVFVRFLDDDGKVILEEDLDGEQIESAVEDKSEVEDEEGEEEEEVMSGEEQGGIVSAVGDVSLAAPTTNSSVAHEKASMGLKKLSMDVLVEVASYGLNSRDILALSWANKYFSQLLLPQSAIHVWLMAERHNPLGLPDRPQDMSPPSFAALVFFECCSMCGRPVGNFHRSDLYHRMRLCSKCRTENTLALNDRSIGFDIVDLIPRSNEIWLPRFSATKKLPPYVLRRDVDRVRSKLSSLQEAGDVVALRNWKKERADLVVRRMREGESFIRFWELREDDLKAQRRKDVETRLLALGWSQDEFDKPSEYNVGPWGSYVDIPKPLLDTEWTRIYTQLRPLLESRRSRNVEERRGSRHIRLNELLHRGKRNARPYLEITNPPPPIINRYGKSSTENYVIPISFPQTMALFDYGFMEELANMDVGATEVEDLFVSRFSEVVEAVRAWRIDTEADLAMMLREGRELDGIPPSTHEPDFAPHPGVGDLPTFNIVLGSAKNPNENQLHHLRPDSLLLLRADSVFKEAPSPDRGSMRESDPLFYPALLNLPTRYQAFDRDGSVDPSIEDQWDIGRVLHFGAAEIAARALLKCLGRPNAMFLELKALGAGFTCGRCHFEEGRGKTWAEMIAHYVEEAELWTTYYLPAREANPDVIYNYIHDLELENEKPLIKVMSQIVNSNSEGGYPIPVKKKIYCRVCKGSHWKTYSGSLEGVVRHVQDVHSIPDPQKNTHFGKLSFFESESDSDSE